jgi:hypothetical protein
MATVTPTYSWPVPTSTDYVKDGATAIESLGDAIDSSLNSITNGKNVGFSFINNSTFTSQTTYNINSLFTSGFTKYKVIVQFSAASANLSVQMQMRTGATNTGTGVYFYGSTVTRSSGTSTVVAGNGATFIDLGRLESGNGNRGFIEMDISNPFASSPTNMLYTSTGNDTSSPLYFTGGSLVNNSTSYDGLSLIASTGNFSGTIQTFGYRD